MKHCPKCSQDLPLTDFNKNRSKSDGLASQCRICTNGQSASWRERNPEKAAALKSEWYQENRDHVLARTGEIRRANLGRYNEATARYRKANPDKVAAKAARRRAGLGRATPSWLSPDEHAQIEAFYAESRRRTEETGVRHSVDHIFALNSPVMCGLHVPWNLCVMTLSENASKGNGPLLDLAGLEC